MTAVTGNEGDVELLMCSQDDCFSLYISTICCSRSGKYNGACLDKFHFQHRIAWLQSTIVLSLYA